MSDDAGYADFGFQSQFTGQASQVLTPNLDQLATQSIAFRNAYLPSSMCSVTRAGVLTGRQPLKFGWGRNALPEDWPLEGFPVDQVTLMERTKQLGYTTGVVGKWHLGVQPQWQPQSQGVDNFYGFWEGANFYYPNATFPVEVRRGVTAIDWELEPSFNNIPPDPTRGRYLTDAFGDEASKFIADHAGGAEPFFLYAPFSAPHSPFDAKAQDLALYPTLTGNRRNVAAMMTGMDRAIGEMLQRIDDPNGDGNQSDSVADNTVVIFLNDNGGANSFYNNGPLAGFKAQGWEGSIKTPMLIRAPNLTPGVFDGLVSALDLFPTLMDAAGAPMTTPTDGVNLTPYLTGQQSGPVHESIAYRNRMNYAGIRKGEWKLVKPDAVSTWKLFRLNPDGSGEDVDLQLQYPEIVQDLVKDFVALDVTLDKTRNSTPTFVTQNDVFVRRNESGANANWQHGQGWAYGSDLTRITGISRDDPNPNMVLVFPINNVADYKSTNVINRATGIPRDLLALGNQDIPGLGEVMLNEIRLEGAFNGAANRKATIDGKALLFARNLAGKAPGLRLDATQAPGAINYTYHVDLDMILYHDFVIEGDGNANFNIGGVMRSFDPVSGVTKRGTSTVTLAGHNTFTGPAIIEGGRVIINGVDAAIDGAEEVRVQSGGRLSLQNGLIRTDRFDASQGTFDFLGGTLQAQQIIGNLANSVGTVVAGAEPPAVTVSGNFVQTGGTLKTLIDGHLPGPTSTIMSIAGQAQLAGKLALDFDGTSFFPVGSSLRLLHAVGGIAGTFSQLELSMLPAGSQWSVTYGPNAVTLSRLANAFHSADFDSDGDVDGADFLTWQRNLGSAGPLGDANADGLVNASDLAIVKLQFGTAPQATSQSNAATQLVPEPSTLALGAGVALAGIAAKRRRRVLPSAV
ncbi:MAG: sulfatase-like hydrolase/transferase [Pirellulales bacterium]|nr:sulfatase-like hydrolase/transferase [Pirellulales bacterium]